MLKNLMNQINNDFKVEWEFFKLQDRETGEEIDWDDSLGPKVTHIDFKAALALARSLLSIPFVVVVAVC